MKKVVIAVDSFKGSMSSTEVGSAIRKEILKNHPDWEALVFPLADGGEGTVEALVEGLLGEYHSLTVKNPIGDGITAKYGIIKDTKGSKTAILEMASASGLTTVESKKRNPLMSTTYGFGQMILDAYSKGCRNFLIGIGGSATSEAGVGMLSALGVRFFDADKNEVSPNLLNLSRINSFDIPKRIFSDCTFKIACDVANPLHGQNGAIKTYGEQKGIKIDQMDELDLSMQSFGNLVDSITKKNASNMPGAGAAGGLGFAFESFFDNVALCPGADIVLDYLNIDKAIEDADILVTGEGRIDGQTIMGKGPAAIAMMAKEKRKNVVAIAGCFGEGYEKCKELFDEMIAISNPSLTLEENMAKEQTLINLKVGTNNSRILSGK